MGHFAASASPGIYPQGRSAGAVLARGWHVSANPAEAAVSQRKTGDAQGDLWQSVQAAELSPATSARTPGRIDPVPTGTGRHDRRAEAVVCAVDKMGGGRVSARQF